MTFTITVQLTEEDLEQGQARNCTECPYALAILRAIRNHPTPFPVAEVRVYRTIVIITENICAKPLWSPMPAEMVTNIHIIDHSDEILSLEQLSFNQITRAA